MKVYYVYIMASRARVIYVGISSALEDRVAKHRAFLAREKQIKGWRRSKKVKLIERLNPHWNDLAPP